MEYLGTLLTKQACFRISTNLLEALIFHPQNRRFGGPEGARRGRNRSPEDSWTHLGASSASGGLLESSWRPLGALLDGSRTEKSSIQRLLGGPRGIPREVSAIGGQKAPQKEAKRFPNGAQEAL